MQYAKFRTQDLRLYPIIRYRFSYNYRKIDETFLYFPCGAVVQNLFVKDPNNLFVQGFEPRTYSLSIPFASNRTTRILQMFKLIF